MKDRPTDQPTNRHDDLLGSYSSNKVLSSHIYLTKLLVEEEEEEKEGKYDLQLTYFVVKI